MLIKIKCVYVFKYFYIFINKITYVRDLVLNFQAFDRVKFFYRHGRKKFKNIENFKYL